MRSTSGHHSGRPCFSEYLKVVTEREYSFTAATEECVREIKEKLCYIGVNTTQSTNRLRKLTSYALPDGDIITVAPNVSVVQKWCSSHIVPINDGSALHHAILRSAGRDLTVNSTKILTEQGYSSPPTLREKDWRAFKRKHQCCTERFRCVDGYSSQDSLSSGCHDTSYMNITKCNSDIRCSCSPCRALRWRDHSPRVWRAHDERANGENQRSPRRKHRYRGH